MPRAVSKRGTRRGTDQKTLDELIAQYTKILDTSSPRLDRLADEIGRLKSQIGI